MGWGSGFEKTAGGIANLCFVTWHTRLKGIPLPPAFPTGFIGKNGSDRIYGSSLLGPAEKFISWRAFPISGES